MIKIQVNDDTQETFDKALKLFKKVCDKDGFLKELRDRKYYVKPSVKERQKRIQMERKGKKNG